MSAESPTPCTPAGFFLFDNLANFLLLWLAVAFKKFGPLFFIMYFFYVNVPSELKNN